MSTKEKAVLRLNASYKIKHEKYEHFKYSFFKDIYNQASQNVKEIIETTDTDLVRKDKGGYTEPISNLIAFDGKRGSGKTSAMLSFCDFLRRFNDCDVKKKGGVCDDLLGLEDKVSFTVLDCTDATLLSDSKELIGAILGKMLTTIKEKEKGNSELSIRTDASIRKLRTRLGEIYCSMLPQDKQRDEASPWEVLEQLSRSWNQQQAFKDSVQEFNEYMSEKARSKKENYLVIPIDDVDMNILNGYALLEAVRKYMMVPNVIVLLAADDYQLEIICRQAFGKGIEVENDSVLAQKLALEYLEKLIPSGRRIHMPDLYREENLFAKEIRISQNDEEKQEDKGQPIKETIIRNIWKYVGIVLNIDDKNSHWLQPRSLRKLSNYVNAMRFLPEMLKSDENQREFRDNVNWFYKDIIKRYLPDAERQYGQQERKDKYEGFEKTIKNFEDAVPAKKLIKLVNGLREYKFDPAFSRGLRSKYSYGNLLVSLYSMRDGDFSEICQATSFILSLQMRRLIYPIENNNDCEEKQNKFKEIMEFSKGDFWGETDKIWLEDSKQLAYGFECEVEIEEFLKNEDLATKDLLLLAMQLDMRAGKNKTNETIAKGTLRFGNFVNCVFNYKNRINEIVELICRFGNSSEEKNQEVKAAGDKLIGEFVEWQGKYGTSRVIPFDSVEFMFNIYSRLYGEQRIFHVFKTKEEYVGMYQEALEVLGEVLKSYDEYFKTLRDEYEEVKSNVIMRDLVCEYKKVYDECPFIQLMKMSHNKETIISKYIGYFKVKTRQQVTQEENGEEQKQVGSSQGEVDSD